MKIADPDSTITCSISNPWGACSAMEMTSVARHGEHASCF